MMGKNILIVSGEPSGDLHAASLVKELKGFDPGLRFFGMGGDLSRAAGVEVVFDITAIALVGLVEVCKNILTIMTAFRRILKSVDRKRPSLAILVDYPGFNLRLAKELKKRSIPVVYYISPQVWAWGADRIGIIKSCVKKILVFFKFEEELYKRHGVDCEFVGHPLVDAAKMSLSKADVAKKYGFSAGGSVIALLPGSRGIEVKRLLHIMIGASKLINRKIGPAQFAVSKFKGLPVGLYRDQIAGCGLNVRLVEGDAYNVVGACDLAIVASGTATLETAILGTPSIVVYKTNWLTAFIGFRIKTVEFLGMVNIIAGREIAPEFIQRRATPENIAAGAVDMLKNAERCSRIKKDLSEVSSSLGPPGASKRAARAIISLLK